MGNLGAVTFDRAAMLARLADEEFDVVVVGGGITGVGCALDAVTRGLRTALVERGDFAVGTSSRSSKLVHGGIRYLQQREFGLVYEALHERQIALRNAPHLVHVLPFLIPILTRDGLIDRRIARVLGGALWTYDLTGGLRIKKAHQRATRAEALALCPTLDPDHLASAYLYYDAQADDARLTLAVARTAADHGAAVANHAPVTAIEKDAAGRVTGVRVHADGRDLHVRARCVVNAAGVWADAVRRLDEGPGPSTMRPAKGIHVTVPRDKVRNEVAMVVPVPGDTRTLFVVPWGEHTYIGTTDDDYDGDLDDPQCTHDDVRYVLDAMNHALTDPLTEADVTGTWAGLRPLLSSGTGKTTDLSRGHGVRVSGAGTVTITGGKLTTYRRMAEDTIDQVDLILDGRRRKCRTKRLAIHGSAGWTEPAPGDPRVEHLAGRYGTDAPAVQALADADPDLAAPLVPGLPYLRAEAVHAVRAEMARSLDDVLDRRTRARMLDRRATAAAAEAVATLIAPELGWDAATTTAAVARYRTDLAAEAAAETAGA